MLTYSSHGFVFPQSSGTDQIFGTNMCPEIGLVLVGSEETVQALHGLAAVVQALRADALAAGVVKPAVL